MPDDQAAADNVNRLASERDAAQDAVKAAEDASRQAGSDYSRALNTGLDVQATGMPVDPDVFKPLVAARKAADAAVNTALARLKAAQEVLDKAAKAAGIEPPGYRTIYIQSQQMTANPSADPPRPAPKPPTLDQQIEDKARETRLNRLKHDAERAARGESPKPGAFQHVQDDVQHAIDNMPSSGFGWKVKPPPPASPRPTPLPPGYTTPPSLPVRPRSPEPDLRTGIEADWDKFKAGKMTPEDAKHYRQFLRDNKDYLPDDITDHLKNHPELLQDPIGMLDPLTPGFVPLGSPDRPVTAAASAYPESPLQPGPVAWSDTRFDSPERGQPFRIGNIRPNSPAVIGCAALAVLLVAGTCYEAANHFDFFGPTAHSTDGGLTFHPMSQNGILYHHTGANGLQSEQTETIEVGNVGGSDIKITVTRHNPGGTLVTDERLVPAGLFETGYTLTDTSGAMITRTCAGSGIPLLLNAAIGLADAFDVMCSGTGQGQSLTDIYTGTTTLIGKPMVTFSGAKTQAALVERKYKIVTSSPGQKDITQIVHEITLYILNPLEEASTSAYESITVTSTTTLTSYEGDDRLNRADWRSMLGG